MELRQLQYALTLAEHRHFGRAADALHIAQPSLSQQIRALEDDLGVVLFERSKRRVALTPDGEAFMSYARQIVALAEDARADLADRGRLLRGRIRLGTTPTLGGHLLPRILPRFYDAYPDLELTITEDVSDHLTRELSEGRLDLALLVEPAQRSDTTFEVLFTEEIAVALPERHAMADRDAVDFKELRDERFILCREGYHLRRVTLEACRTAGFVPRVALSGTNVDTALRFVQAGFGVTLVPELAKRSLPGVATASVSNPPLQRSVGLAWHPKRYVTKATDKLRDFFREELPLPRAGV